MSATRTAASAWVRCAALVAAAFAGPLVAAELPVASSQPYWVEQLADGLDAPWSMAWLPDGDLLIVEKFGGLRLFHHGTLQSKEERTGCAISAGSRAHYASAGQGARVGAGLRHETQEGSGI